MSQSPFRKAPFRSFLTLHPDRASWAPLRVCASVTRNDSLQSTAADAARQYCGPRHSRGERFSRLFFYGGLCFTHLLTTLSADLKSCRPLPVTPCRWPGTRTTRICSRSSADAGAPRIACRPGAAAHHHATSCCNESRHCRRFTLRRGRPGQALGTGTWSWSWTCRTWSAKSRATARDAAGAERTSGDHRAAATGHRAAAGGKGEPGREGVGSA